MIRLPFLLVMALVSSSAPDSRGAVSPLSPEPPDASFPKLSGPDFQSPTECPVENCLFGPVTLTREARPPAKSVSEFLATEGQEAELVIVTSDRKRTTLKVWLNEVLVLRPSALPRSASDEVRVPITLAEQNVLEFRLTAKPGTQVVFWIEGGAAPHSWPEDPDQTLEFRLSATAVGPTATMNAVCSADHGANFEIADWADVVAGTDPSPILEAGTAWIQWDGLGSFSPSFFGPTYHYLVSSVGNLNPNFHYGTIEPDLFWLNAAEGMRRVLCKRPSSP